MRLNPTNPRIEEGGDQGGRRGGRGGKEGEREMWKRKMRQGGNEGEGRKRQESGSGGRKKEG